MNSRLQRLPCLLLLGCSLLLAACGGGSAADGEATPPLTDSTAPVTSALPGTGLYSESQFVTLTSNEPGTIYYTTDGIPPTVGGTTTTSGASPISGILISSNTSLRYFSVDGAGNEEFPKTSTYSFDFDPPGILLSGFPPLGTYGFLEVLDISFSSDETVSYLVEVGGDGTAGTGVPIQSAVLGLGQVASVLLPCWWLDIGQQSPGNSIWIHVVDAAGGSTSIELLIKTMAEDSIALGGSSGDLELTPDGSFGYLIRPDLDQVWKFDTDPDSASFNTFLAEIDVVASPTSLAITGDSSKVYVTGDAGFSEIDVSSNVVTAFPMSSGLTPSGIVIHDLLGLGLVGASDGSFWQFDLDPLSGQYLLPHVLPAPPNLLETADITLSEDEGRAIVAWTGPSDYNLQVLDTSPGFGFGTIIATLVEAPLPAVVGTPVISSDTSRGWASNEAGRLGSVSLSQNPPVIAASGTSPAVGGMVLSPDESVLLVTGAPLNGIRVVDPVTLQVRHLVASGGASGTGTGRRIRYSADGKRAYLIRDEGAGTSEIWMIWLTSE
jgi:hypothetical protein